MIELQKIIEPHDINNDDENRIARFFIGAVKRKDSEFMKMVADEMYAPHSQENNPRWTTKMDEIANGTFRPQLTLVD